MALGRTDGLDRADVDGPRTGGQRRPLVQPDRQGPSRADPGRRVLSSRGEPRRRRGRPCDRDDVLGPAGNEPEGPQRGPASRPLSTAADPPALDPETREPRDAAAGDTDGPRPGGPDGGADGPGTDLRARLRGAQLRLSPRTGMQRRAAPRGRAARGGLPDRRRCRPEELLRHDPARPPDGPTGTEGVGWADAWPDRVVPQARRPRRLAGVAAGGGLPAGGLYPPPNIVASDFVGGLPQKG